MCVCVAFIVYPQVVYVVYTQFLCLALLFILSLLGWITSITNSSSCACKVLQRGNLWGPHGNSNKMVTPTCPKLMISKNLHPPV